MCVEHTTDYVVSHSDQVLHTATAEHNHRVFLQIVSFTWNVSCDFHAVSKAYASDFAESRVRLLWSGGGNFGANATLERRWEKYWAVLENVKTLGQSHGLVFGVNFHSVFLN